ncbi:MAG: ISAs1 family transposase [Candidatus Thorarchaeota archaeon]
MKCKSLMEILSEVPDFRKAKGKRHPLSAILAMSCVAIMCGCRSYSAIADWGRNYDRRFIKALGFTHKKTPCIATLYTIFKKIDIKFVETKLGEWSEGILGHNQEQGSVADESVAVDGKALRGSLKQGADITYLLSAVSHQLGLTLAQCSVDFKDGDKTNEIGAMPEVLKNLVLEGKIITTDAMHTQRVTCQTIVDGGGDYVTIVKDNQHQLLDDVKTTFHGPFSWMLEKSYDATLDAGHGRIEKRCLTACDELPHYMDWPGVEQVFMVERATIVKKTGEYYAETVYGITSLTPQQADASRLSSLVRGHWHIENRSHWVRDVTFDEDRSQVRSGNIPQVMAALRNTAIGLMRWAGETNIAAACRMFAAKPRLALKLIGAM